ncbi:MAG: AsmA family protein [Odoribacter sp.]
MFKSFPDLNVALKNVTIAGEGEFAGDTIVNIPLFEASVNLKSLISGDELIVNRVFLKDGRLLPTVNTAGKANWDIMIHGDTVSAEEAAPVVSETASEKAKKGLSLKDISIENLYIAYHDYKNSQYASVGAINLNLSGNFSESNTMIRVLLALKDISYRHQNSVWVNKTDLNWQAEIAANLKELTFDILKNDLAINDLKLNLIGNVAVVNERYNLDLQLNAPTPSLKVVWHWCQRLCSIILKVWKLKVISSLM